MTEQYDDGYLIFDKPLEPMIIEGKPISTTLDPVVSPLHSETPTDQEQSFAWKKPAPSRSDVGFNSMKKYVSTNTSFSGCDIRAIGNANGHLKVFAELQTLSYSIHREKMPVRTLGRAYPKGYTRGPRTIAGSLIFTIFDRQALWQLVQMYRADKGLGAEQIKTPLVDQLPPFDITVTFDNEYGSHSYLRLYGIDIIDEGQSHSIDDMITENVMSYVARDIEVMSPTSADAWGEDGKVLYNQGLFFANKMGEAQAQIARGLIADIATLKAIVVLSTSTDAEVASANRQITMLEKKLQQAQGGEMMIERAAVNDGTNQYDIPYDYSTWKPQDVNPYTDGLKPGGA